VIAVTERHPEKDPREWVTGDEPMTGPQESYLRTLAREAAAQSAAGGPDGPAPGRTDVPDLTKAEASQRIDELKRATGR
jgi:hypothetical protein